MMKKYGLLATALLMSMTSLQADGQQSKKDMGPSYLTGGPVVGFSYSTIVSGGVFQVGYYGQNWLFDIGANTKVNSNSHNDRWDTSVLSHLGGRSHLHKDLSLTYGVVGMGEFITHRHNTPWTAGVFTGLDYQISKNFLLSGKTYPYNYNRHHGVKNNVFSNATISFFYVF